MSIFLSRKHKQTLFALRIEVLTAVKVSLFAAWVWVRVLGYCPGHRHYL
jgi:hypothetical protein